MRLLHPLDGDAVAVEGYSRVVGETALVEDEAKLAHGTVALVGDPVGLGGLHLDAGIDTVHLGQSLASRPSAPPWCLRGRCVWLGHYRHVARADRFRARHHPRPPSRSWSRRA